MRMFRSFLLRLGLILSVTAVICLALMTATLSFQGQSGSARFCGVGLLLMCMWLALNWFIVRKIDPELSLEVARMVFPAGMITSIVLSSALSVYLGGLIPGDGKQHYILPFVGIGITFFLIVRCFDMKWLRPEEEIAMLENLNRRK